MPIRVEVDGLDAMEFEDGTPQSVIDSVVRRSLGESRTTANRAKASMANRASGKDLPPGYAEEDIPKPGESRFKSFAREAGIATTPSEGLSNLGRMGSSFLKTGAGVVGATLGAVVRPDKAIIDVAKAQLALGVRGREEADSGDLSRGLAHTALSAIPLVGPAAASVADKMFTPEMPEGVGEAGAYVASPKIINKTARVAGKTVLGAGTAAAASRAALTETVPNRMGNALLGASRKYFKFGVNPGRALKGIVADSLEEMAPKLEASLGPLATRLDVILSSKAAQTKRIDIAETLYDGFKAEIERAKRNRDTGLEKALMGRLEGRMAAAMKLSKGERYVTPDVANAIKQNIGEDTRFSTEAVEGTLESAMQDVYTAFNKRISEQVPASRLINERLADALTAKKALQVALENQESVHPLGKAFAQARRGGAVGLLAFGHPIVAAALAAPDLLRSVPVSTRLAAGLSKFAKKDAPLPQTQPTLSLPPARPPIAQPPHPYQKALPPATPQAKALPPSENVPLPGELQRDFLDRVGRGGEHLSGSAKGPAGEIPPTDPTLRGAWIREYMDLLRRYGIR